jgi:thiol:disulfide interchange protein DsbG
MAAMKRRHIILASGLALTVLAGCKDAPAPATPSTGAAPAAPAAAAAVNLDDIAGKAKGFTVGSSMSTRVVYVFFDPQCPHCAALWTAAKPLKSQARWVWIPVSLLNANSTLQGAALLAAPNGEAAMDGHEVSMRDKRGGIQPQGDIEAHKPAIAKNTELFNTYQFNSVPTIVGKHAQSGVVVKNEGAMPTAALAGLLGLQAP